MSLGSLVVDLLVKADTFTVKDFSKAIGDIPLSVATAITSMAGLSLGFIDLTRNIIDMTTGLKVFTSETGLNTGALQQWQQVAKEVGLSADVATGSLSRISQLVAGLKTGHGDQGALLALGQLGVRDLSGDSYSILNRMQGAALGKDRSTATALLVAAGFNPALMRLFDIPASQREGLSPTLSEGNMRSVVDFQRATADFEKTVTQHFVPILEQAIPPMIKLGDSLGKLMDFIAAKSTNAFVSKYLEHGPESAGSATRDWFDSLMERGTEYTRNRTMHYEGGEVTYNFNGLTDSEQLARRITEEHMRRETMQHTAAMKAFGNQGAP